MTCKTTSSAEYFKTKNKSMMLPDLANSLDFLVSWRAFKYYVLPQDPPNLIIKCFLFVSLLFRFATSVQWEEVGKVSQVLPCSCFEGFPKPYNKEKMGLCITQPTGVKGFMSVLMFTAAFYQHNVKKPVLSFRLCINWYKSFQ